MFGKRRGSEARALVRIAIMVWRGKGAGVGHGLGTQDVQQVREALASGVPARCLEAVRALDAFSLSPVEAVDLLERACAFGRLEAVRALYEVVGEFAYASWALALALRCAHEDVARELLARGVDLLGPVQQPTHVRALLPHEGTFTRFDLTRQSPTLFLNPLDPTVSTEVFEAFGRPEQVAGGPYSAPVELSRTCDLVGRLAEEGAFDQVVFADLFRAALVKAWHALRHEGARDEAAAETCLALGARLLALHQTRGMGGPEVPLVLGDLIVPKVSPRIVRFVCESAPCVFLDRLMGLSWLRGSTDLVRSMVPYLSAGSEEQNGTLLRVLAEAGCMEELRILADWPRTLTEANLGAALAAASETGHAQVAAWLLGQARDLRGAGDDGLGDLLL